MSGSRVLPASAYFANRGMRAGPRENGDLIRPTKTPRRCTYFVPSSLRLQEVQLQKAVLLVHPSVL